MATEERLRDELNWAASSVGTDTPAALVRVLATARRRQRVRRAALVVAAVALVVVGAFGITHADLVSLGQPPPPANSPHDLSQPTDMHAEARTRLTGEWQTAAIPAAQVRSVLTAAGIGSAVVDRTIGDSRRWFVQMTFNQNEGTAELVVQTSDPTRPGTSLRISDTYLYRLLPGNRLLIAPKHPGSRWVFTYRLDGDALRLELVRAASSPLDDRTLARFVAWTFAPLTLVH